MSPQLPHTNDCHALQVSVRVRGLAQIFDKVFMQPVQRSIGGGIGQFGEHPGGFC